MTKGVCGCGVGERQPMGDEIWEAGRFSSLALSGLEGGAGGAVGIRTSYTTVGEGEKGADGD